MCYRDRRYSNKVSYGSSLVSVCIVLHCQTAKPPLCFFALFLCVPFNVDINTTDVNRTDIRKCPSNLVDANWSRRISLGIIKVIKGNVEIVCMNNSLTFKF